MKVSLFFPTGFDDPIDSILSIVGNKIINQDIQKLSDKLPGLIDIEPIEPSKKKQIDMQLQKQEAKG